nr:immunoglobulin heavy chain junction region [Macaca mulatta]
CAKGGNSMFDHW